MGAVVLLGVLLGLDSFRASLGLGVGDGRKGIAWRVRVTLAFGVCDGLAPVLGLLLGAAVVNSLSPWAGLVGPIALGGVGLFTFLTAGRGEPGEDQREPDLDWPSLGLPLALSLDNLVAGFGLGAIRVPVILSAVVLGIVSGAMALAGLYLGSLVGQSIPARAERVGGAALVLLAAGMAFEIV